MLPALLQQLCQKQVALPLRLFGADKQTRNVPAAVRTYVNLAGEGACTAAESSHARATVAPAEV